MVILKEANINAKSFSFCIDVERQGKSYKNTEMA